MATARDVRAFPSEMTLLLGLLIVAVMLDSVAVVYFFSRNEDKSVSAITGGLLALLMPGLITSAVINKRRRRNTVPLRNSPFPDAAKFIEKMVQEARLRIAPELLFGANMGNRAFVAGKANKSYLAVGPELLALRGKNQQARRAFEAVIRHEIAHLNSKDLRSYYLVTVLRVCNIYTGIRGVNYLALHTETDRDVVWLEYVRIMLLVLIVELVARAFLRAREHYADLHAAQADLQGMLAALTSDRLELERKQMRGWRTWIACHPSRASRVAALLEPGWLLTSSPGYLFLGATFAGVALQTVQDMLIRFTHPDIAPKTPMISALLVGVPLTVFVAFGIWRETWHAAWLRRAPRTLAVAGGVTGGLLLGSYLAPFTIMATEAGIKSGIPLAWTTMLTLATGMFALCYWLATLGAGWYRRDPDALAITRFHWFAVPVAGIVGGWVFVVVWTWCVVLMAFGFVCGQETARTVRNCTLPHSELHIAQEMIAEFVDGSMFLVLALAVGALVLAKTRNPSSTRHS